MWRNGGAPYDHEAALAQAPRARGDFVARVRERVCDGGVCVCALDTELLGHWWYEGVGWLEEVIEESARQGLALTTLDDALERHEPVPAPQSCGVSSWGEGGDLRTWSGPPVADLAWQARTAELRCSRRASEAPRARACASCWRCRRATGRSWPPGGSPATTRGSEPRGHQRALERALAGDARDL